MKYYITIKDELYLCYGGIPMTYFKQDQDAETFTYYGPTAN